ncbi:hypothetical protein [Teredinibacter purpureus]|uniref:hypothetical protein n=1 Tax=Teredinibacter purpureus TaxID=2731756 RepID=UPI0005F82109|nr:hypothetical protein [Teredinibacter purpureus]
MKKIDLWFWALATSSKGNPFVAVITIMCFYVMFAFAEASIETLFFGEHFLHWLDPIFALAFMTAAGYSVWQCAKYQMHKEI